MNAPPTITIPDREELVRRGLAAVLRELGPVGYARFVQALSPGQGDYTSEHQALAERLTMHDAIELVNRYRRETGQQSNQPASQDAMESVSHIAP